MQYILSAAILAASQPLMASAAYLPARQASNSANMTAPYGLGNSTTAFPTTGGTGYGTGYATGRMTTRSAHGTGVHTTKEAPPVTTKAALSSAPVMMNSTAANSTGDASPSRSVQLQPSAINNLGYDAPVYNLNNSTCGQMADLNYTAQWAAVSGDDVVDGFQKMWNGNLLICSECFGLTKDQCTSNSLDCAQGLQDLAKLPGSNVSRWDTAAARFAADADITDLQCSISTNACNSPPSCGDCNGPGSFAILKSLSVLDNAMSNVYRAIQDAGSNCEDQMQSFSDVFAPLPSTTGESMFLTIMMAIVGALIGAVSLLAGPLGIAADTAMGIGLAAGAIADVGSGIGMQLFYEHQPGPADTGSVLGSIVNQTAEQYFQITDALFSTGTYSYRNVDNTKGTQLTLQNMMKGGNLMETSAQPNGLYEYLLPNFELIMYQQLAFYTWSNLEKDKKNHIPFIAFNPKPCDQVSTKDPGFGSGDILDGVIGLDSNITYDGACYWLLDALPHSSTEDDFSRVPEYIEVCGPANTLPGGTNKDLSQAGQTFSGLSLQDFIVPSVGGWKLNNKNNDYQLASANGQVVDTPTTAGAINIPVCDYVGNPKMPGVNCPKVGSQISGGNKCDLVPLNAEPNAPGTFQPGWCSLHVIQYQKTEGNENPLSVYQLEVTINDAAQRQVGDAAKQAAGSPLSIAGALPYDLIVAAGATDNDPLEFWYADQYWNSDSTANQCKVGKYDGGNRQMDCGFNCPMVIPENGDSSSATIAHKLPAAPTPAAIGATSYLNTWPADATTTAPPTSTGLAKPTYATGACGVHVRQHQKNEPDNQSPDYAVEVTLYDAKQKAIGSSGQVLAPKGQAVDVTGLVQKFTVTAGSVDSDPLSFTYGTEKWSSSDQQCSVGKYDSGARDMDCGFICNP